MSVSWLIGLCVLLVQGGASAASETDDMAFYGSLCKLATVNSPSLKLRRYLFCDYDPGLRPTIGHLVETNVTIGFMPQTMDFDEGGGVMSLHSWMTLSWQDQHLTWSPEQFEGLKQLHVMSHELWLPDISIYNSGDLSIDQTSVPPTDCLLSHDGTVMCVPTVKHVSTCETDFTLWPFDRHKCTLKLGSWSHSGEEINVRLYKDPVLMQSYVANRMWDLTFVNASVVVRRFGCCPNSTYPIVHVRFDLSRHSSTMHKVFVTPAMVLTVLTLTVMWLDSRSTERIAVAAVNFICHLLCIMDLHWRLPANGSNAPNILLFYRDSLALTTFALVLTVLLRKLRDTSVDAPGWIGSTTAFVLSNRAARFLILDEEGSKRSSASTDQDHTDVRKSSPWGDFAALIEWASFFSVVLAYAVILLTLLS